ncbi:MAG: leucine-rich repeat domain-containing protein [Crenarchaeota archaeon]|nr:leucine-rich repeat domain-containing protein [Thermoproteota archaeon]
MGGTRETDAGGFAEAAYLSEIVFPYRIPIIPDYAFCGATGLTSVTFETLWHPLVDQWFGVESIGKLSFASCVGLTSITLPRTVSSIGELPFFRCSALAEIGVDPDNEHYASVDDILYNKALTQLIECPCAKANANLIPSTITSIPYGSFSYCSMLQSVSLPSNVATIGPCAFSQCTSLRSIRIPSAVTSIDDLAFAACSLLRIAYFSGTEAPSVALNAFDWGALGFHIRFREGSTGYTTPYWRGYPCACIPNVAPVISDWKDLVIHPGQTLTFSIRASDENEDDLEFSAVGTEH